ncbi:MAG TPA: type IX secretion system membrane protein PorP/SprF [Bacteroidales bacterium]|nr:type IX secretion system membrane protein PorP/SprF [Bacteroidales bacterium]
MRYLRKYLSAAIISFVSAAVFSQQVPMYSQYIMNGFLVNPSFAGRDGYTSINLTVREQWVGMEGAPGTFAASFQTRILRNSYISKSTAVKKKILKPTRGSRVGLGGYVFNDQNGAMRRTGFQAAYAYHIPMGLTNGYPNDLAFGLSLSAYQFAVNTDGVIYDPDDPFLNTYDRRVFIPDFNFGASFTTAKYYAGVAMTNLFRGTLFFADSTNTRTELGYFFLTGGMKFPLTADWTIEPSGYIRASDMLFKSAQMDLTARVFYKQDYWAGLSFRTANAIILMGGLKYDRFYLAYASDFALTSIRKVHTMGTHEITLAVKFGESARRYRWITPF